jgi:PPE-repeat protein
MVDYGLLPPEINSGLIYAGPGAGSLLAAAAAWRGLAADLQEAASGHRSVITALTSGPWLGPAAASLTASVSPFLTWLDNSAEQAAQAASQATAAMNAYETAFAASVPPALIAANRALLQELIASNLLGQNSSAISTLEAQYAEFWAQDSGAMYSYAGSASAATKLAELPAPAEVVDSMGVADQAVAVVKAQYNTGYTNVASQVNPRVSDVLKMMSSPINGAAIDKFLMEYTPLGDMVALHSKYLLPYVSSLAASIQSVQSFGQVSNGLTAMANFAKPAAAAAKAAEGAASAAGAAALNAGQAVTGAGSALGGVAAGLGKAIPIGGLSAPANWVPWHATTNPGIASAIPAAAEGNSFPMAPPFGQFFNGGYGRNQPTYGFRPSVMAKPPAAG